MPVTWLTAWVGTLALIGFPFFAGFYSKDAIIEAVGESQRWGSGVSWVLVTAGVFITALYSFRLLYLTFHGSERFEVVDNADAHHHLPDGQLAHPPKESPLVVTVPLLLLAVPSVVIGWLTISPVLFGGWLEDSIFVKAGNDVLGELGHDFHGPTAMALHAVQSLPFWLMLAGFAVATYVYMFHPAVAVRLRDRLPAVYRVLSNKYYFDDFYQKYFAGGALRIGQDLWRGADAGFIDGWLVNGSARAVQWFAARVRRWQSGYLYDYAFAMIVGIIVILAIWVVII